MAQQIDLLKNTSFEGKMDSLIEAILKGENYDYAQLMNKPAINGYTLEGNKTNAQLGIPTKTSDITNDSGFIEDKNYVHTDENFTSAEKTKLDSVENGAEANVQANWSETDSTEDSFIKNKPTIPSKTSELSNDSNFVVDADYKHTDNNYTTADKNSVATIGDKVDKVTGKELSTNDLTDTLKANYDDAYSKAHTHTNKAVLDATTASFTLDDQKKLTNIESGAQKNTVTGVKGSEEEDYRVGNVNITKTNVGLGNVGNFKAVSTVASQGLTDTEKANARANIGAGTGNSNFSGAYVDLSGKPTLGTAASKDVASTGNASTTQVVMGNDTRLSDSRKASDVYAWAKVKTKPSYTKSEVGLGNVPNVTTNNQTPTFTKAGTRDLPISGETLSTIFGKILKWFSDLKSVAFTGDYTDLSNQPTDATTSAHGLMTAAMVRKLNGIATNANNYSLPTASSSTLGGVKVGSGLKITNGVLNLVWQ